MSSVPAPPSEVTPAISDLYGDESVPTLTVLPGYDEWEDAHRHELTESEEADLYEHYIASLIYTHQSGGTLLPGELELVRQRIPLIA
jgi:hypothetical protein